MNYFYKLLVSDESELYEGRVFGETHSHVNAQIENGILTAAIHTKDDSYHVEVRYLVSFVQQIVI